MIEYRDYHPGDYRLFTNREGDTWQASVDFERQCEMATECYTITKDGLPVAIVAGTVMWEGVAEIWAVLSDEARGCGIAVSRISKRLVDDALERHKIRRAQVLVNSSKDEYVRWVKCLGFGVESRQYGAAPDGNDLLMLIKRRDPDGKEERRQLTTSG